jgi:hypothetical protein
MASKVLPTETIGDDLPVLLWQRKRIIRNCGYNDDIKEEWVQAATGDVKRTSLKSITQKQARWIIMAQEGTSPPTPQGGAKEIADKVGAYNTNSPSGEASWAVFDNQNAQHRHILSLCRQAQWTTSHPRHGEVADLVRLDQFLKSNRCPVNKSLKSMTKEELVKVGHAINQIIKHKFK